MSEANSYEWVFPFVQELIYEGYYNFMGYYWWAKGCFFDFSKMKRCKPEYLFSNKLRSEALYYLLDLIKLKAFIDGIPVKSTYMRGSYFRNLYLLQYFVYYLLKDKIDFNTYAKHNELFGLDSILESPFNNLSTEVKQFPVYKFIITGKSDFKDILTEEKEEVELEMF